MTYFDEATSKRSLACALKLPSGHSHAIIPHHSTERESPTLSMNKKEPQKGRRPSSSSFGTLIDEGIAVAAQKIRKEVRKGV